jgi:ribosomal protein L19
MKLKLNIYKTNLKLKKKFEKCTPNTLKRGDYLRLHFLAHNQKRRGGKNLRVSKQTVILFKKKRKGNSLSFIVTSLYKHEKVKWRYLISSPHMVHVKFLKKALSYKVK